MSTTHTQSESADGMLVGVFLLGQAAFAIDTAIVDEVVLPGEVTPVHHAPHYVAGIRNLRGKIVTVIDLGVRLNLGAVERTADTRILILGWSGEQIGFLVDAVHDMVSVAAGELEPPPANLHGLQNRLLRGVFQEKDRLVALLDPTPVLETEEAATSGAVETERA